MTTRIMLACMVEMAGMQAQNQARIVEGELPTYLEQDFKALAKRYGLDKQPTPVPPKTSQPDALPAAVEAAVNDIEQSVLLQARWVNLDLRLDNIRGDFVRLRARLAALWPKPSFAPDWVPDIQKMIEEQKEACVQCKAEKPKAGQVPSVEKIKTVCPQCGHEHPVYRSSDWIDAITHYVAPSVQPSPVTAEKLEKWPTPEKVAAHLACQRDHQRGLFGHILSGEQLILLADYVMTFLRAKGATFPSLGSQPTLGQGLTREDQRVQQAVKEARSLAITDVQMALDWLADSLLALQPQAKVSREQWDALDEISEWGVISMIRVRQWLKDIGMEVEE